MENAQDIADRILSILDQRGISRNKMLKEVNLSNGFMDAMSNGHMPTVGKLLKIADYLNVSLDYLLGRASIFPIPINPLFSAFNLAPENVRKCVEFALAPYITDFKTEELLHSA